ncbi:MAG: lysostaphin resistance A-like protein [Alphaproteobacteria bacterium]
MRADRPARPLGWRDLALIVILFLVLMAAGIVAVQFALLALPAPVPEFMVTMALIAIMPAALGASVYLIAVRRRGLGWAGIGFRPTTPRHMARALGLWLLCLPMVALANYVTYRLTDSLLLAKQMDWLPRDELGWPRAALLFALIALIVPVAEEAFFRGVLYGWLRRHWRALPSALVSAALFSLAHLMVEAMLPMLVLGLALAWIYERSGSLWPAVAAHMAQNGATLVVVFAALSSGVPLTEL